MSEQVHQSVHKKYVNTMCKNVRLPGTSTWLCHCSELCLNSCSDDARLPGMSGCPAARKYARLSDMPGCPAARYTRLPGNMPGCPVCPAARKYARLSDMPGCPAARKYARLPGNMPGTMPGMSGSPASALQLRLDAQRQASAAPLATSVDRDERQHAATPKNRA